MGNRHVCNFEMLNYNGFHEIWRVFKYVSIKSRWIYNYFSLKLISMKVSEIKYNMFNVLVHKSEAALLISY